MTNFIPPPPSPSHPGSSPPNDNIPVAPPPWTLKAKAWTFFYSNADMHSDASPQNPNNSSEILNGVLPPGAYHPLENLHPEALEKLPNGKPQYRDEWIKGVMVIRYEDSDVGPYDELILVPSQAVNPRTGKADKRISNIYVSEDASVWNGRRNWNIPKHRAVFDFKPVGKDTELRVYHPEDSPAPLNPKVPFFTAVLKGSALPKIPLPKLAPMGVVQPPLLKSRSPFGAQEAVIGTDDPKNGRESPWLKCVPAFKGSWGLAYAGKLEDGDATLEYHGDGVSFPKMKFWSVGSLFEGDIIFGVAAVAKI